MTGVREEPYLLLRVLARPRAAVRRRLPVRWRRRLAVLVGGAAGTALRAGLAALLPAGSWPWPTLLVNLSGALLLGYLLTRFLAAAPSTALTIPLICIGVLGSYTTFSGFVVEVFELASGGHPVLAVAYATTSVVGGVLLAMVGRWAAEVRP